MNIGCFISCHGYGHATRCLGIVQKLADLKKIDVSIFSTLPNWFLEENLNGITFHNNQVTTDIGLVQEGPFKHDLFSTIQQLEQFLKFDDPKIERIQKLLQKKTFDLLICDISPLGIYIGKKLGIPVCLVENFTWDWIYQEYLPKNTQFKKPISVLKSIFDLADLHIQTNPICEKKNDSFKVNPIFRPARKNVYETKESLNIQPDQNTILVTTGGIPQSYAFVEKIRADKKNFYILTGSYESEYFDKNFCLLPHRNKFYFPDLVSAANCVVGKVGYGTVAESWGTQKPLIGVYRHEFRESEPMKKFVDKNLPGFEISYESFIEGSWIKQVGQLIGDFCDLSLSPQINGRDQVAEIILKWNKNKLNLTKA